MEYRILHFGSVGVHLWNSLPTFRVSAVLNPWKNKNERSAPPSEEALDALHRTQFVAVLGRDAEFTSASLRQLRFRPGPVRAPALEVRSGTSIVRPTNRFKCSRQISRSVHRFKGTTTFRLRITTSFFGVTMNRFENPYANLRWCQSFSHQRREVS